MYTKFRRLFSGRGGFGSSMFMNGKWGSKLRKGVRLDGVDDYIDLGNILNAETQSLTFALWFFHNAGNINGNYAYVSRGVASVGSAGYALISNNGSPFLHLRVSDGVTVATTSLAFPVANQGRRMTNHFLIFTIGTASNIMNAQISGSTSFGQVSIAALGNISTTPTLWLGAHPGGQFSGITIYQAMAWTSVFTTAQMRAVFYGSIATAPNYNWDFNNIKGSVLVDTVGGANGTIYGGIEVPIHDTRIYS